MQWLLKFVFSLEIAPGCNIVQYIEKENFRECFPIGAKRMEKLFILTFLLTPVLTIPGFLCSVIIKSRFRFNDEILQTAVDLHDAVHSLTGCCSCG